MSPTPIRLTFAFLALATGLPALGQDNPATPAPAPAAPALFPQGYSTYEALSASLRKAAEANPGRVTLGSLGKSLQGRDIWLVTLGGAAKGEAARPSILVVGNLEADHVVGSQVALGMVETLAASSGKDAEWLDRVTVYVVPRLNPDGAERLLAPGKSPVSAEFVGNLRPLDRDRDGREAEDGPDDLDGDGAVARVRYKDPAKATLVADGKDPRVLRKPDPTKGERAVYAEEAEGKDDDGDGPRNEDPPGGVNLNRNWPHKWTEFNPESGFSPASEPEVQALIAFAVAHPEIAAVWTFGHNDNLKDEPKKPGSELDDADLPLVVALSKAYRKATTASDPAAGASSSGKGSPAPGATTDGALSEWAYHQFGALGLASRVWSTPEIPAPPAPAKAKEVEKPVAQEKEKAKDQEPAAKDAPRTKEAAVTKDAAKAETKAEAKAPTIPDDGEARWLYWNDQVMGGRAFVPWHPFEHPTLGKVELGGWRPGVRVNPPGDVATLAALAASHLAFLTDLAGRLPKLAMPVLEVTDKGAGLFEVRAVLENQGELPTALAQGVKTRKAAPILVRISLGDSGVKVVSGRALERIDSLAGAGGRREFRWLLLAPAAGGLGKTTLDVSCPRAGRLSRPLTVSRPSS